MLPSQNSDAHLFHVVKQKYDFHDFMVLGPTAPGARGTVHFLIVYENLFSGLGAI